MSDEEPLLEGQTVGNRPSPTTVFYTLVGLVLWLGVSGILLVVL